MIGKIAAPLHRDSASKICIEKAAFHQQASRRCREASVHHACGVLNGLDELRSILSGIVIDAVSALFFCWNLSPCSGLDVRVSSKISGTVISCSTRQLKTMKTILARLNPMIDTLPSRMKRETKVHNC
jgi:hypothetical protein